MKRKILLSLITLFCIISASAQYEDVINSVKLKYAPDKRVAIFEVKSKVSGDTLILEGKIDKKDAKEALLNALKNKNVVIKDNIRLLPDDASLKPWAMVIIPYAHLRTNPGHEAELTSQALMGTPLRVLEQAEDDDNWYRVQTPDNYISWVIDNSIKMMSDDEMKAWRSAPRYISTPVYSYLYADPEGTEIASDLVLGDILVQKGKKGNNIILSTPDGRTGYAKDDEVEPLTEWAKQSFNPDLIVDIAKQLMGSTYTWGGTSTKGVDCSGLTKTSYFANGIILQRDASQQVLYGEKISPIKWSDAKKGDLLYFGTKSGRVTHTAIYMGDGKYIHASARVKVNSVNPKSPIYLTTPFISINRIDGNVDKAGIYSVKNHPWYFNLK